MPDDSRTDGCPLCIRPLAAPDVPAFLHLVQALADYERLPGPSPQARERLTRDALAVPPRFSVLLAEREGHIIGYAVYFETYSTFLARPTLYLEDIFVLQEERGRGAGRALMRELAREAVRRGCAHLEWQVLSWNTPAQAFYQECGARPLDDWQTYRLAAEQLESPAELG